MSPKLIIRLKNNPTMKKPFEGYLMVSGTNSAIHGDGTGELSSLAKQAQSIVVIVPGEDVLLTEVILPKMSPARLVKAIPFALEDHLTEDPSNLHFAQGAPDKSGAIPLAIVSREKMREWETLLVDELADDYAKVKAYIPDTLAVPLTADSYQLVFEERGVLVRTGAHKGFVIEKEQVFSVLKLALKQALIKPAAIHLMASTSDSVFTSAQVPVLGVPVHSGPAPCNITAMMAETLQNTYSINLLQGPYRPQQKKVSVERLILMGFVLVGVWLGVVTFSGLARYVILHHEKNVLSKETQSIYKMVYPQLPLTRNPKEIVESELQTLRASRADSGFSRLLKIVGPGLSSLTQSGLSLKGITYRNNQLLLDLEAKDLTLVDKLRQTLETQGLKVVQSNAQRGFEGLVETRITAEEVS